LFAFQITEIRICYNTFNMGELISINPSTSEVIGKVAASTQQDVTDAVAKARQAQAKWAELSLTERCARIASFVKVAQGRSEEIAKLIATETGRPIESARGNVEGGINYFNGYLETAQQHLAPQITYETDTELHRVFREPWGVIACICPWNYPFMNIAWQCGQALIAGNTVVYKNSEENPLFAKLLVELIAASDIPDYVFNVVYGDGQVGQYLANADIDMISFTGSTQTGKKLTEIAAEKFIPIVTELGGSAPLIVFEDKEITDELAEFIWGRRFKNAGQACDAVKRLIVHESKFDSLVEKLRKIVANKKVGNALDEDTDCGPLVAKRQLDKLESQVKDAIDKGAKIEVGGSRPENMEGIYYLPTIITNIKRNMRVWREEVFGPVLPIIPFSSEEEAIELANDTEYGLGAHVMTNNRELFNKVAQELQSGMVAQNEVMYWHPRNPFGGYKQSGMGRTHGEYGFHEVTQVKLVSEEKMA
jgi:succinate-semialdehyde dehydrogenase/glutarate-semialdehyde dehydrogenase